MHWLEYGEIEKEKVQLTASKMKLCVKRRTNQLGAVVIGEVTEEKLKGRKKEEDFFGWQW